MKRAFWIKRRVLAFPTRIPFSQFGPLVSLTMQFFQAVALLCLLGTASAQALLKTKTLCTTRFGTKSVTPKSTSYAITIPITYRKKVTVTPVRTITPPASSATVTTTKTSTIVETSTPTTVITNIQTVATTDLQTGTITSYTTTTVTTTTTGAPSVIPAAPGFTALGAQADYRPKRRSLVGESRFRRQAAKYSIKVPKTGGKLVHSPAIFPTSTICVSLVQAITTSTKTVTASSTVTSTLPAVTKTATVGIPKHGHDLC